jgi:hypothetical protein
MRRAILATTAGILGIVGCTRPAPIDLMTTPAVCDSISPLGTSGAFAVARIPRVGEMREGGAVVGTVTDARSGQPLWHGDASLAPRQAGGTDHGLARVSVDSLGGFVLLAVPPGAYTLRVRALHYKYEERPVVVQAGAVDTVRVALRYYVCRGY